MLIAEAKAIIECVPDMALYAAAALAACAGLWAMARQGRHRFSAERR